MVLKHIIKMSCVNTNNKLYYNLVNLCDTETQARNLYATILNPDFIRDYKIKTDKEGIPVFKDVYKKAKLGKQLKEDKQIKFLESKLNSRTVMSTPENIDTLGNEVTIFNNNNDMNDFVAVIEVKNRKATSKVVRKNQKTDLLSKKIKTNTDLNSFLKNKLSEIGVSVGTITELERRRGIAGVTEFNLAKDATNGIIELIRISNDEKGAEALPEEFSHFALEAMGENNQLVNRLYNIINEEIVQFTLGDTYNDYYNEYNGDIDKLKKETAGKLLAEYIKSEYTGESFNLIGRVFNAIKDKFSKIDDKELRQAIIDLDATLSETAKKILKTNLLKEIGLSNINNTQSLYNLDPPDFGDFGNFGNLPGNEMGGFDNFVSFAQQSQQQNNEKFNQIMNNVGLDDCTIPTQEPAPEQLEVPFDINPTNFNGFDIDFDPNNIETIQSSINTEQSDVQAEDINAVDIDTDEFNDFDFSEIDSMFSNEDGFLEFSLGDIEGRNREIRNNRINIEKLKEEFNKDTENLINELNEQGELEKITNVFVTIEASLNKLNTLYHQKGYTNHTFGDQKSIESYVYKNKNMLGNLLNYVFNSINNIAAAWDMYDRFPSTGKMNKKCNYLITFSNTIKAIDHVLNTTDTQNLMNVISMEFSSEADKKIKELLQKYTQQLSYNIGIAKEFVKNEELSLSKNYLSSLFGDKFEIPMTLSESQTLTLDDELSNGKQKDIGFMTRWLSSLANTPSLILQMTDMIVKESETKRHDQMFVFKRKIVALGERFIKETGDKDFNFLYARDKEGKRTGYYIAETDYALYEKYYNEIIKSNKDEFIIDGEFVYENYKPFKKEFNEAMKRHNNFHSDAYDRLTPKQKEFVKEYMELKKQFDEKMDFEHKTELISDLPEFDFVNQLFGNDKKGNHFFEEMRNHKTIKIEKTLTDKLKNSKSTKDVSEQLKRAWKEQFVKTSSDTDLNNDEKGKAYSTNFDGERVYNIPKMFTKMTDNETEENMSLDPISTLVAYGDAAINRYEKMQIVSILDVIRSVIYKRELAQNDGKGDTILQKLKTRFGVFNTPVTKSGKDSNILALFDDYIANNLYGIGSIDLGNFGNSNISVNKVLNFISGQTAALGMSFNFLGGIQNVISGEAARVIEASSGQFFSIKSMHKAKMEFAKNLPAMLAEWGNPIKKNKLSIFVEQFNVMQNFEEKIRNIGFDKNRLGRVVSENGTFIFNNIGEAEMSITTALAICYERQGKDKNGKSISFYDSLLLEQIDNEHPEYGMMCTVNDDYVFDDKISNKEYAKKLSYTIPHVIQMMDGIYNSVEKNALSRRAHLSLLQQFRKYIITNMQKRFGSAKTNLATGMAIEPFYTTTWKFLLKCKDELTAHRATIPQVWKSMNKMEKQNVIRAATEIGQLAVCYILSILSKEVIKALKLNKKDDDDDNKAFKNMARIILMQPSLTFASLAVFAPTPFMVNEALRLLKNPFAACRIIDQDLELLELLNPTNWTEDALIKQGKWDGHLKGTKILLQTIPGVRQMLSVVNPLDVLKFYTNIN